MKTCVITGVTGQMGSYFAEFLLNEGYKVVGTIRRLSVPNHTNIEHIKYNPNFVLETMDLGDANSINTIVDKYKPDYFLNFAANSFVGGSWALPEQHMNYNCLGVLRQLEAIKKYSPTTRYLNAGSSEEFGDVQFSPQTEDHPLRARSPYGASKIAARQLVKVYRESYGLYAIQPWSFNHESERRGLEFVTRKITSKLALIFLHIYNGNFDKIESVKLGNIYSKRDWSHVLDFVDGNWKMLNQDIYANIWDNKPKEYVLSSGKTHSIKDFINTSLKYLNVLGEWQGEGLEEKFICDKKVLIEIDPKFYRPAEVDLLIGDSTKIKTDLNWEPKISFEQLVEKMLDNDVKISFRDYNSTK